MSMDKDSLKFSANAIIKLIELFDDNNKVECMRLRNILARINACKYCKYYHQESNCIRNMACLAEYNQYYQFEEKDNE